MVQTNIHQILEVIKGKEEKHNLAGTKTPYYSRNIIFITDGGHVDITLFSDKKGVLSF